MDFRDKFLPNQPENMRLWRGFDAENYELELFELLASFNDAGKPLDLEVPDHVSIPEMASSPAVVALLQFLVGLRRPNCVIEIGSFIGISTIKMAQVMPYGSRILTFEKGDEFAGLAARNLTRQKLQVEHAVFPQDALPKIREWAADKLPFVDFVYLDGDKDHYDQYLEPLTVIMRPGALLVVDDAFFHGDVLNRLTTTAKGRGVKRLLNLARDLRWSKVLLPLSNGVLIMQKPGVVELNR